MFSKTEFRSQPVSTPPAAKKRRTILKAGSTLLISIMAPEVALAAMAAQILAVRVWPAEDYTRVTLENNSDLKTSHFIVKNPERLVVDIEGIELNPTLKELVAKIQSNDPYIKQVRVGQNRPNVVRLVFDLKEEVNPQVFTLQPVGNYQHRLVFDLYPANPPDPIAAMIEKGDWHQDLPKDVTQPKSDGKPDAKFDNKPDHKADPAVAESDKNPAKTPLLTRMITIAIDPGHGGEDPGAIGRGGSREKDVVLSIAKRLKAKIELIPNMRVMLTRDGDYFVPLNVRVQKARAVQADLFMSVHADAFVNSSARGSSVFVLSEKGASSSAARWLADKENAADLIGGVNIKTHDKQLASVLLDLSTTAQINDSLKLGKVVLSEISGINRLHKGAVEQAGFAVLKAPDIPSILIESAFISNPEEEAKLTDDNYQDQMADAVVKGIKKYFSRNPPLAKNRLT
ncbi:N-acetylmuramoyl-L-alanine amidase [Undibacterium sp. Jales W-56]|uniref:N-acetylmuramoyl-L-alanine amidase n=1 Tax=Undibacterium sp. Jales W-56 TaxID=2897325 RepID=UPI0021D2D95E|nr:N-acetylmuramoyl-L-alanine amidase [Undibacterium sp. Jales W-56]MCU6434477.1 N-acetylmuramoyl-L-alanine amidase [Undibacterium sp. Jales W-56]